MALLQSQPFFTPSTPNSSQFNKKNNKKTGILLVAPKPQNPFHRLKKNWQKLSAVAAEEVGGDQSVIQEEVIAQKEIIASYDWTEEWYPLYLTKNVPDDAPLGLTVFDKQVVLYRDGNGELRCYEDRCPHRLAKLSEGQLFDGRLECLYHGWQFEGNGKCVKIPQLSAGAKIPQSACVKTYEIKDSQGVIWIWMSHKTPPKPEKIPRFENFDRPGFRDISTIHELPYDHSILLENLMDPAHVPISHDRTDFTAKREDATSLFFEVTERTDRGFAGHWGKEKDRSTPDYIPNFLRFEAPCVLQNNREIIDKNGKKDYFSGLFLCRPSGQGKSMLIVRFGNTRQPPLLLKLFPAWYFHQNASKVFEQDMGFLSSQNEILMKEKVPTRELYINLKSSDTWVFEYRKWMDKVGHGMPYYFGHSKISLPEHPAVIEHAPAGFVANISASQPAKGGIGNVHAPNPANRYFRHVVHCKECMSVVKSFRTWKNVLSVVALVSTALAILVTGRQWKGLLLFSTSLCLAGIYVCSTAIAMNTTNFIRTHRSFSFDFYSSSCPDAEMMVRNTVRSASDSDPTVPGKLLRLLFHDCFVEGCDGSVLLQGNGTERSDPANKSLGGFSVIDSAKGVLEFFCPETVSCADILALAARDAVQYVGGPDIRIPTGRKDGKISAATNVRPNIIDTSFTMDEMAKIFSAKGLSIDDLVTLSGAHTIGRSHCSSFNERFKLDSNGNFTLVDSSLDRQYAAQLTKMCPAGAIDDSVTVNNDPGTPLQFDNQYYKILTEHKGLFESDSALFNDVRTKVRVMEFANNQDSFFESWGVSFLKLVSIGVKTEDDDAAEIRQSCFVSNR